MDHYYALIMAGGGGTRLWPLSRRNRPKQSLLLVGERSMFQISVDRLTPLFRPEQIFVVTGPRYVEDLQAQSPGIPPENFIVEPEGRNTGPAAGLGTVYIQSRDPDAVIAVLTSDHYIRDMVGFRALLALAHDAAQGGHLVTLGIDPVFPSTGFGYIHQGETLSEHDGHSICRVLNFKEKPDEATAKAFLASGEYSWNSGMFIWRAADMLKEFERQQPETRAALGDIAEGLANESYASALAEAWPKTNKLPIDYAIMENAEDVVVIPAAIGWDDVGSWRAIFDVVQGDEDGNIAQGSGRHIAIGTTNSLVHSKRLVVTIGVEDLVIVDTGDVVMVCHRDQSQAVRDVVDLLKANDEQDYL